MAVRACSETRLAPEQDSRLSGDLREHRSADVALGPGAADELAELVDARALLGNPCVDGCIGVIASAARQKLDAQLLEIARKTGGEKPLPLVGGNEPCDLLLRPVEAERFAEARISAGQCKLV